MDKRQDTVLVTGATGFTGGALTRKLIAKGERVRALVRDKEKAKDLSDLGVELMEGDIRDSEVVDRAVTGVKVVYHIAAVFRTAGHPDSYYREVNVEAVDTILKAAAQHGVERTVHCSTVGVHGHVSEIPSDENSPYNPGDIYQVTKLEGERVAQEAMARGQAVSVVRPAGIYGPGDLRFLKLFKGIHKGRFRMFGSGEVLYHFTYIDDLVDGIILCGEHERAAGEIFIICGDDYVSLNKLVELIADAVGKKPPRGKLPLWPLLGAARVCETICRPLKIDPPLHTRRCEFFIKDRAFRNDKARELIGYRPSTSIAQGVKDTAQWYFEKGYLK